MSSWRDLGAAALLLVAVAGQAQPARYDGIGRAATAAEIAAWDIDVRPDFKGLPKGAGSVASGMQVWEAKCASCHGVFGESNEVFSPIVGGTGQRDTQTGNAARLADGSFPGRTTLMKLASLSTLWDYINRAMPWNSPKSLTVEEVYAVTAYILHMGAIVPDKFTLSDSNMADVQQLLPNRNGMSTAHALWPGPDFGKRKPDVAATACMKNCATEPAVVSQIPDFARNAHGNLAEQNRSFGAQRGVDTSSPPAAAGPKPTAMVAAISTAAAAAATATVGPAPAVAAALVLAQKHNCLACHGIDRKIVGPSLQDITKKYAGNRDAAAYLAAKVKAGGAGVWGTIPMPPQDLSQADADVIAAWLSAGAIK